MPRMSAQKSPTTDTSTNGTDTGTVDPNLQAIIDGTQALMAAMPALLQIAAACRIEMAKTDLEVLEQKMAFLEKTTSTIPEAMKFNILVGEVFPHSRHVDLPVPPPTPVEGEPEIITRARMAESLIRAIGNCYGEEQKAAFAVLQHFGIEVNSYRIPDDKDKDDE